MKGRGNANSGLGFDECCDRVHDFWLVEAFQDLHKPSVHTGFHIPDGTYENKITAGGCHARTQPCASRSATLMRDQALRISNKSVADLTKFDLSKGMRICARTLPLCGVSGEGLVCRAVVCRSLCHPAVPYRA